MPPVPLAFDSRGANANRAYLALALGLVSRIAATRAIDAIVVKGAAAELTGLRPPKGEKHFFFEPEYEQLCQERETLLNTR